MDGWMESLQAEVQPFGINTTIVNPGFFRTELLTKESTKFAENPIKDYNERRTQQMGFWKGANGQQPNDPAKLAEALVMIAEQETPPLRFIAGEDAVGTVAHVVKMLTEQTNAYRELSGSMGFEQ